MHTEEPVEKPDAKPQVRYHTIPQNKLWRSQAIAVAIAEGAHLRVTPLTAAEFEEQLLAKLLEEAGEVAQAHRGGHLGELRDELADVLEVLMVFAGALNVTWEDVVAACEQKRQARGSYTQETFVERAIYPDGHSALDYYRTQPGRYHVLSVDTHPPYQTGH